MWNMNGGAAPPGQQSMKGERGVQGERNGIPWTPLSHLIGMRSQRERATAECDAVNVW